MNINLYDLRAKLRLILHKRIDSIQVYEHPFDYSWLVYAFDKDYTGERELFNEKRKKLEKWVVSEQSGQQNRDLGALSICYILTSDEKIKKIIIEKAEKILNRIHLPIVSKFSILNDPIQVYCLSLGLFANFESLKERLEKISRLGLNGRFARKIFYASSLIELKSNYPKNIPLETPSDIIETILLLWFLKKYLKDNKQKNIILDQYLSEIANAVDFELLEKNNDGLTLHAIYLALLFEFLSEELKDIDPILLFQQYPLHSEIKKIARDHFINGKYISAIFESIKKLFEFIQHQTAFSHHSEVTIVRETMNPKDNNGKWKNSIDIPILFNSTYDQDKTAQNEQHGLALITEGLLKAFRHPKGHKPEDDQLLQISPYEAIDQLVIVSYILKRIERARIKQKR